MSQVPEHSVQFMLKEIETIRQLLDRRTTLGEQRVNILITLASATSGALLVLGQTQIPEPAYYRVAFLMVAPIALLATAMLPRLVRRRVMIVAYFRALNRIRRYFVDLDPVLAPYLALPSSDDVPHFALPHFFGLRRIVSLINSMALSGVITIVTSLVLGIYDLPPLLILEAVFVFVGSFSVEEFYTRRELLRAGASLKVVFPASDS